MTNAQILSAVISKWSQPLMPVLMNTFLSQVSSSLLPVEKFLKNWGFAGQNWSISDDIKNLSSVGVSRMLQPLLSKYFSKIPDEMIPIIAHNYVDSAIQSGSISLIGGRLVFEKEDLVELKRYLDCNMPYENETEEYEVKVPAQEAHEVAQVKK